MKRFLRSKQYMAACIVLSLLLSPTTLRAVTGTGDSESETVAGVEQQQTKRTITGTVVTGDTNEPAVGATVYLRNSTTGSKRFNLRHRQTYPISI